MKQLGWINLQSHQTFSEKIRFLFDMGDLIQTQTAEQMEAKRQKEHLSTMGINLRKFVWYQALYHCSQNFLISTVSIIILISHYQHVLRYVDQTHVVDLLRD